MGVLIWIARAILLLLILRLVLRFIFPPRTRQTFNRTPESKPIERAGGELVRDPQCGTYVPKGRAIALQRGGETIYFCSEKCRDEYGRQV